MIALVLGASEVYLKAISFDSLALDLPTLVVRSLLCRPKLLARTLHNRWHSVTYHNLVLHGSIAVGRCSRTTGGVLVAGADEVVGHLRVELLGRLLGRAGALAAAFFVGGSLCCGSVVRGAALLAGGSGLGLGSGLTATLLTLCRRREKYWELTWYAPPGS